MTAWLGKAPREIVISVESKVAQPSVRVHDAKPVQRVANGVGGAAVGGVYTVAAGCRAGPIGCGVGLIFAPVGMLIGGVSGAASVKSADYYHPLDQARGAPELFAATVTGDKVAAQLAQAVVEESQKRRHAHRLRSGGKTEPSQGELTLSVQSIGLSGKVGNDPAIGLDVVVAARLVTGDVSASLGQFRYEGSQRRVSEWRRDESRLFVQELDSAMRSIAKDIVARLHTS